jgi:hypothetical protein
MRRVGFLYNHDAAHQVRHSAAVITPLARAVPDIEITVLAASHALMEAAKAVVAPQTPCRFVRLDVPAWHKPFLRAGNAVMPAERLDRLHANRALLRGFDALVVTEGTSRFLKRFRGFAAVTLIRIDHGAGDRSIGYQRNFAANDLVILAGEKQRARHAALGYLRDAQMAVCGYPKFDTVDLARGRARRLFDNARPTVLYSPHHEPKLSSWYGMGEAVLEYFYRSTRYNLIFAPHVMLFKRRLHVSPEWFAARIRKDLPERYRHAPHMLIDTGSAASIDMTYTLAADIYLGDVSSQVYEFIAAPRPCVFLDPHRTRWQGDPNFESWTFGPVVGDVDGLDRALARADADFAHYRGLQEDAFARTFSRTGTPASRRAADAIARVLRT